MAPGNHEQEHHYIPIQLRIPYLWKSMILIAQKQ
jgi:hypothetical protein